MQRNKFFFFNDLALPQSLANDKDYYQHVRPSCADHLGKVSQVVVGPLLEIIFMQAARVSSVCIDFLEPRLEIRWK